MRKFSTLLNLSFFPQANSAELYWNSGQTTPTFLSADVGITDFKYSSQDGITFCTMKRYPFHTKMVQSSLTYFFSPSLLKSGDYSVDLTEMQTILLAGGPYAGAGELRFHTKMLAAGEPVLLRLVSSAGAKSDLLVKLHGLFMLVAWLGCAGAGMIMARYFKQTWKVRRFIWCLAKRKPIFSFLG